jgi:hypothetical protein
MSRFEKPKYFVGQVVIHALTKEEFLIIEMQEADIFNEFYSYHCRGKNYETHWFRENEIELKSDKEELPGSARRKK